MKTKPLHSRLDKFLASFNNRPGGDSARKWSAFIGVSICVWITIQFTDTSVVVEVLMVWLVFSCLCLAIITGEQLVKLKNGTVVEEHVEHEEDSSKTTTTKKVSTPVVDEDISQ